MPNLELIFEPQRLDGEQQANAVRVREACRAAAAVVMECTPPSADQTAAVRHLGDASMTAVRAISTKGKAF